jgi:hypothetical protein
MCSTQVHNPVRCVAKNMRHTCEETISNLACALQTRAAAVCALLILDTRRQGCIADKWACQEMLVVGCLQRGCCDLLPMLPMLHRLCNSAVALLQLQSRLARLEFA